MKYKKGYFHRLNEKSRVFDGQTVKSSMIVNLITYLHNTIGTATVDVVLSYLKDFPTVYMFSE